MAWFDREPEGVRLCGLCGCPIQRTSKGSLDDGVSAHLRTVHADYLDLPDGATS